MKVNINKQVKVYPLPASFLPWRSYSHSNIFPQLHMGLWTHYFLLVTHPDKSLSYQFYSKRKVKSQGSISASLLPKRIRDQPCWGVNTLMVNHFWYSLKLQINKKQSIKQQLKFHLSYLLLTTAETDQADHLGLIQLKACLGLVELQDFLVWGFFVFVVWFWFLIKKEKQTKIPKQTKQTNKKKAKHFFIKSQIKLRYSLRLLGLFLVSHI